MVKIKHYFDLNCGVCEEMKPELDRAEKVHPDWVIERVDVEKAGISAREMPEVPVTEIHVGKKKKTVVGGLTIDDLEVLIEKVK